jgi:hypothetical protein
MKALILDKKVVDLSEKEFDVSPSFTWVDCDDEKVKIGWGYDGSKFTDPFDVTEIKLSDEEIAYEIRNDRNLLLAQSDWTQIPDSALSDSKKKEWVAYRKSLRDIPSQSGFPKKVTWPERP